VVDLITAAKSLLAWLDRLYLLLILNSSAAYMWFLFTGVLVLEQIQLFAFLLAAVRSQMIPFLPACECLSLSTFV